MGVKGEVWGTFPGALWAKSLSLLPLLQDLGRSQHQISRLCLSLSEIKNATIQSPLRHPMARRCLMTSHMVNQVDFALPETKTAQFRPENQGIAYVQRLC